MVNIIKGGISEDYRGNIRFVNDFNLTEVKRFYIIKNSDTGVVRGWRAHKLEQRWFYVIKGSFKIDIVKIDDWMNPSIDLEVDRRVISSLLNEVLHLPKGYATAFQAIEDNSELLVFADSEIEKSKLDDYTWDSNYFINRK